MTIILKPIKERMKNISIYIPPQYWTYINQLIAEGKLPLTRGESIRQMVLDFMDREDQLDQLMAQLDISAAYKIMPLFLPESKIQKFQQLLGRKKYISRSEAIRMAVRDWLITLLPKDPPPTPVIEDPPLPNIIKIGVKTYTVKVKK